MLLKKDILFIFYFCPHSPSSYHFLPSIITVITQPKMISIKSLAESPNLNSIPSNYAFTNNEQYLLEDDAEVKIPTVDFSLLTSGNPDQRSKAIYELGKACEDWGFFTVINHGVPERLMGAVIDGCRGFFELSEEDKEEFKANHVLDPIRYGTSFNASVEEVFFWRDYLKVFVHPQFHFPNKPSGFSEISQDYCKRTQEVARKILEGISESLGLEANYIDKALNLKSGFQLFAANFYPPCPQPELAMGMPPHSDHGLLTILTQNGIGGLQIQHNEMWVNVNALPNSFLVNTGDHLQVLTNGKYKSVIHRAVVNNKATRISLAIANGPSLDSVVAPAPELLKTNPSVYIGLKYKDYMELQQSNKLDGKSCLDRVRL
ncbi:hypothetical protein UlMin_033186 [Ulmus minor]